MLQSQRTSQPSERTIVQNHERLSIEDFGKVLLESNDLDPVYVALHTMHSSDILSTEQLNRWVLAYSCLYHAGVASYLSEFEGEAFFAALMVAARNEEPSPLGERWPRAKERRHWRGKQAEDSCAALWSTYGEKPEQFLTHIIWGAEVQGSSHPATFPEVAGRVRENRGYGGWIAFKIADMIDRLGLRKVDFNYADVVIYRDPILAAEMVARQRLGLPETAHVKPQVVRDVFEYLVEHFAGYGAPPLYDRPVGLPEVESIACKWKSHQRGHYPLYNDLHEIHDGLVPWMQVSEVASFFKAAMPKVPAPWKAVAA
jgi:hypothetical protein